MEILTAFLVTFAIALLAGVLLIVFSHFFSVPENETTKRVRACLPGINCGACGYKGCDDYAAAVSENGEKPTLCVPGAQETADELSAIMGLKSEPFKDVVAFVSCNGHIGATGKIADYDGMQTCRAASMLYAGTNACRFGCLGLGDCANVCPSEAICLADGLAHVDTSKCLGCGLCARTCPKNIISMVPQHARTVVMCSNTEKGALARKACTNACIGCKKCEKACPHGAIVIKNNLAVIDYDQCTHCGNCVKECPTGCLKAVFFPNLGE